MGLYNLGVALNSVVPKTDGVIMGTRNNQVSSWVHFDIINLSFMANESKRSHGRLEVPDHDCVISGCRHNLFEVWVESYLDDLIFVSFEGSFERWVSCNVTLLFGGHLI